MQATIEGYAIGTLFRTAYTARRISKWERELRKAIRDCQYCRAQAAEAQIEKLNSQYDELMRQLRKGFQACDAIADNRPSG